MVAEHGLGPAHPVEGVGLADRVAGQPGQLQRTPVVAQRLVVAALPLPDVREVVVRVGLADQVAGHFVQPQGVAQLGAGLGRLVARAAGGQHGGALGGGPVPPVPLPVQEGGERPGQPPRVGGRCEVERSEQHLMLGGEPGQRGVVVVVLLRADLRGRRGQGDRVADRVEQAIGGVRGVQVMLHDPALRGLSFLGERLLRQPGRHPVVAQHRGEVADRPLHAVHCGRWDTSPAGNQIDA